MVFKKGDIILPKTKVALDNWLKGLYHAAVVWQDEFNGRDDFIGLMLTHSARHKGNILMQESHFAPDLSFKFDRTRFANQALVKFGEWGPFERVGQLTKEGVLFIERNIDKAKPPVPFTTALNNLERCAD